MRILIKNMTTHSAISQLPAPALRRMHVFKYFRPLSFQDTLNNVYLRDMFSLSILPFSLIDGQIFRDHNEINFFWAVDFAISSEIPMGGGAHYMRLG